MKGTTISLALALAGGLPAAAQDGREPPPEPGAAEEMAAEPAVAESAAEMEPTKETDMVIIKTTLGDITVKLSADKAPLTVANFLAYADAGHYDGTIFHRVIDGFMIQGGDPLGTGYGEPGGAGFPFKDEFSPSLRFSIPGRLAMANSGPNTNGSQFFITEVALPELDDKHTIFGQCEELSVIKAIARTPTEEEKPVAPVLIRRVKVERVSPRPAAPKDPAAAPAPKAP